MIARHDGRLRVEGIDCEELAREHGTPLFVYSRAMMESAYREFVSALAGRTHLVCYAVKANSNLGVLDVLARLGAGFDIVSGGELERVLVAGGEPSRIVFSGVGKSAREISRALDAGIRCFNVESAQELERLGEIAAAHGVIAPVSIRINPDVDAGTHPYISTGLKENKFGVPMDEAPALYRRAAEHAALGVTGIDCHIGSQLTSIEPYRDALAHMVGLVDRLADEGIAISHLDAGGGQGIRYADETPLDIAAWARVLTEAVGERELELLVEPGRYLVGPAGVMLTRIEYLKYNSERGFAVVDAGMNDLIRPALYSAFQAIEPVIERGDVEARVYDVVGPVCESADFLGKERRLAVAQGDVLAVMTSGAYAAVMSSNYNTRPRAAEILVDGSRGHLVRAREETSALFAHEHLLPREARGEPIPFTKMHGLGNDFMVIDDRAGTVALDPARIRALSDRHTGVGFDQLLVVAAPSVPDVEFDYRIFNADGAEVEHCGNGARCFARFVHERGLTGSRSIAVNTASGVIRLDLLDDGGVTVRMGVPDFSPPRIPLLADREAPVYAIEVDGKTVSLGAVSIGNPHAVLVVDDVDAALLGTLGPALEAHPRFPRRVNVGFLQVVSPERARLRVFERGVGETRACGTGACAAVAVAHRQGLLGRRVRVALPGGELEVVWPEDAADGTRMSIEMTGPCSTVFEGLTRM